MKRELKYIFRRILVGVGIVLVLSFVKSCNVKATYVYDINNSINYQKSSSVCWDGYCNRGDFGAFFNNENNSIDFVLIKDNVSTLKYSYSLDSNKYFVLSPESSHEYGYFSLIMCSSPIVYNGNNTNFTNCPIKKQVFANRQFDYDGASILGWPNPSLNYKLNFDMYNINNVLLKSANFDTNIITIPELVSWHATKRTSNDVLLGYIFRPEFSTFDTDNYIYEYKFNNSPWLILTENEQIININANGTIYVQIKDKNTSEVIDSATFTATKIGTFINEQTYDINFSGDYRTENYLNNNTSSKSQSTIIEYQIYTDFQPKSSILKYQYQYVVSGNSLDNDNWITLSSSDNGTFTYVTSENGTLYARILDSSDSTLYTATFTVNSIGLLAFDSNDKGINNFFTKLSNKISYGGPISNLFRIPVDILDRIYSYSSDTCSPYKISNLLGTDIVLPCYDFRDTFGDSIYTLFDSLLCFVLSLTLFNTVRKMYDKFINMEDISS